MDAIGVILMVDRGHRSVLSMIFWSSWGGMGGRRRATYVEEGPPPGPGLLEHRRFSEGQAVSWPEGLSLFD